MGVFALSLAPRAELLKTAPGMRGLGKTGIAEYALLGVLFPISLYTSELEPEAHTSFYVFTKSLNLSEP